MLNDTTISTDVIKKSLSYKETPGSNVYFEDGDSWMDFIGEGYNKMNPVVITGERYNELMKAALEVSWYEAVVDNKTPAFPMEYNFWRAKVEGLDVIKEHRSLTKKEELEQKAAQIMMESILEGVEE